MLEKSFSLLFYLKKPKNYLKGAMPIYLRITVDGIPKEISTGRQCDPIRWNMNADIGDHFIILIICQSFLVHEILNKIKRVSIWLFILKLSLQSIVSSPSWFNSISNSKLPMHPS